MRPRVCAWLSRRAFLKKTAVGGGALVIGFYLPEKFEALAAGPAGRAFRTQRLGAYRAR